MPAPQTLLCVLANPPIGDGIRTRARVKLAGDLLGYDVVKVENLFAIPSPSVTDIALLGSTPEGWMRARVALLAQLKDCDAVLLAYGVSSPTGPARQHFEAQVEWLITKISKLPVVQYQVGDLPRHPSRWQRWTARQYPQIKFQDALCQSFRIAPTVSNTDGADISSPAP